MVKIISRAWITIQCTLLIPLALLATNPGYATELELTRSSGSVITVDTSLGSLTWQEAQTNGALKSRSIRVADIQRLTLCQMPASTQLAEIKGLLNDLGSEDYRKRMAAENALAERSVSDRYPSLIRSFITTASPEVAYRLERIERSMKSSKAQKPLEFDQLLLKSGQKLLGDAGSFELTVNLDGRQRTIRRNDLRMIRSPSSDTPIDQASGEVQTEAFHQAADRFYTNNQTFIDFNEDMNGNELKRTNSVEETYIPMGIKMRSAEPGYIGVSGYGFKFPGTPTGGNSASVFVRIKNGNRVRHQRFKGTALFEFCMPNQPAIRAGVHEFGVHIANVNHSRDFILEAFNADGNVLASVEAGSRDCPFLGVKSNALIASVRLRSNPFLGRLKRKIDEDYAFDAVCFSTPNRLPSNRAAALDDSSSAPKLANVMLDNGDARVGRKISLKRDGSLELIASGLDYRPSFDLSRVRSFTFANRIAPKQPKRNSWSALLLDGSRLHVTPGTEFTSQLIPRLALKPDQLAAVWPADQPARYPAKDDFQTAGAVVVVPTGRHLTDKIRFNDGDYRWKTIERRIQELPNNDENPTDDLEAILPERDYVNYRDYGAQAAPTLWLQRPTHRSPTAGFVQLTDGQRLMFGSGQTFQLTGRTNAATTLSLGGKEVTIPTERIETFKFEISNE